MGGGRSVVFGIVCLSVKADAPLGAEDSASTLRWNWMRCLYHLVQELFFSRQIILKAPGSP